MNLLFGSANSEGGKSGELAWAHAREAATREILDLISRSRSDAAPVFKAILHRVAELCNAHAAALVIGKASDTHQRIVAQYGEEASSDALYDRGEVPMDPEQSFAAEAIVHGKVVHVADMRDSERYRRGAKIVVSVVEEMGIRTNLWVPLQTPAGAIGCFVIYRKEVRPYTTAEIALAEHFAAQAVIAIENAEQFREVRARLAREEATRQVLSVISQSPDDERPVFDTILANACELCDAQLAFIVQVDASGQYIGCPAHRGCRPAFAATLDVFREPLATCPLSGAVTIREKRVIRIDDIANDDLYRSGEPNRVDMVELEGIRSLLVVPMLGANRDIGSIVLYRREVAPFSDEDAALVETFAAQAVIAIENVRQFRAIQTANAELETRLAREAATREILEAISQSRDDEKPVFDVLLRKASQLCGAPMANLSIITDDGNHSVTAAQWGEHRTDVIPVGSVWPLDSPHAPETCIREGRIVHIHDLADTDLYVSGDPVRTLAVEKEGVRTLLNVPLISDGRTIGCISTYRHEVRPFTPDEIALVETFAAQAVIAIENVRQFKALEALNAELGNRVQEQVGEIERMGRLKRFLPAAVADAVVSSGSERMLSSHRVLLGVLFCDIRGFTAFCETAEPEETIEVLQTYHEEMGKLIDAHGAGVDHRMGDGIMVLFNDPLPCDDPAGKAVRLALAMRVQMAELCQRWKKMGHRLGFGVGISLGYATVGIVGSGGRIDYTASGTAINLASRLADEAHDGEILLSPRARTAVEDQFPVELRGELTLKGIREPVEVFRLTGNSLAQPKTA